MVAELSYIWRIAISEQSTEIVQNLGFIYPPEWWNWQTRRIQNPMGVKARAGSSPASGNALERYDQGKDGKSPVLGLLCTRLQLASVLLQEAFRNCNFDCKCSRADLGRNGIPIKRAAES